MYLESTTEVKCKQKCNVNKSIALQSPYMQIRGKLFVLNENAAKHLHLDPCRKITQ